MSPGLELGCIETWHVQRTRVCDASTNDLTPSDNRERRKLYRDGLFGNPNGSVPTSACCGRQIYFSKPRAEVATVQIFACGSSNHCTI